MLNTIIRLANGIEMAMEQRNKFQIKFVMEMGRSWKLILFVLETCAEKTHVIISVSAAVTDNNADADANRPC